MKSWSWITQQHVLQLHMEVNIKFFANPAIHQPTQTQLCSLPGQGRYVGLFQKCHRLTLTVSTQVHIELTQVWCPPVVCQMPRAIGSGFVPTDQRMPAQTRQNKNVTTVLYIMQAGYNGKRTYTNHPSQGPALTKMADRYEKSLL